MSELPFTKMHGLGNDFVIIDGRVRQIKLSPRDVRAISDRHTGIGCDQVITVEKSKSADAFMRIHNSDGYEVEACGNGTRCVASLLLKEKETASAVIETIGGLLVASSTEDGRITVDMGEARLNWDEIPLVRKLDTLHIDLSFQFNGIVVSDPCCVGMGNPHAVFFVNDLRTVDIQTLGPYFEKHPLFPKGANISFSQVIATDQIRTRVWERGAGLTLACGTAACATLVAAVRRKLTNRRARIEVDGGILEVLWRESDSHVEMTGPVATSFTGIMKNNLNEILDPPIS